MSQTNQLDKTSKNGSGGNGKGKPKMTVKEASFHETQAARRAMEAAKHEGASPEAIEAMMELPCYQVPGTEIVLQRLNLQVIWAMEKVGSAYVGEENKSATITMHDVAMGILCFSDAMRAWKLAKQGKREELEEEAFKLMGKLDQESFTAANLWINAQFARTKKLAGDDGGEAPEGNAAGAESAPA